MTGESKILAAYRARTPRAAALHRKAVGLLPSGIVHDSRRTLPYGIYGDHALGSRKWDVDGNEYVDYYGGHGSLLLGHQHPEVIAAVQKQLGKGMHLAAAHELEVEWARLIQEIVPSVESVVQVMKLTDGGNAAQGHLEKCHARGVVNVFGRKSRRSRVHHFAPRPKRIFVGGSIFRSSAQHALKGMRMRIDHAGQNRAVREANTLFAAQFIV